MNREKTTATLLIAIFLASMLSVIPNASATTTTIDFDSLSAGTLIQNQYQGEGVIFSSMGYLWGTTESQSSPNFLAGYPATYPPPTWPYAIYPVTFEFVVPGTSTPAATGEVSVTLISVGHATVTATAYDSSDNVLSTISVTNPTGPSNGLNNKDAITFSGVGPISKVDIRITTPYPGVGEYPASYAGDGFGIDDLSFDLYMPVIIDIKPGSDPNSVNLGANGLLPVAILGSASFDVNDVDIDVPITLGDAGLATRGKAEKPACSYKDVNEDGFMDLITFFPIQELGLSEGDTLLTLDANLLGGIPIVGSDSVRIVPPE